MCMLMKRKWTPTVCIVQLLLIHACLGMSIPEDMEILDGYKLDPLNIDLVGEEDGFYERRSLVEPFFYRAIRDRRDAHHQPLESLTPVKNFPLTGNEKVMAPRYRVRRDVTTMEPVAAPMASTDGPGAGEELPVAEKQTLNHDKMEQPWTRSPYKASEFQSKVTREEGDSNAEESMLMMKEGIKSRAPRVNFITQQIKSSSPAPVSRDVGSDKFLRELYQKPLAQLNNDRSLARAYDTYMAPSQSPMYPQVYNKYDAFHRDMMDRMHPPAPHRYDHYYERRYDTDYDSYFPRYKFPYYYYYPDRRYDVPMYYRDRNYLYTNDIDTGPYVPPYNGPLQSTVAPSSMRNRRIIYFATLPEIVRPPTNANGYYRFRQGNRNRYDTPPNTRVPQTPVAYKDSRPVKDDRKEDKYVSSRPIKIVREVDGTKDDEKLQDQQQRRWSNPGDMNRSAFRNRGLQQDIPYFGRII